MNPYSGPWRFRDNADGYSSANAEITFAPGRTFSMVPSLSLRQWVALGTATIREYPSEPSLHPFFFFFFFFFFFLHNEAPADRFTTDCLSGNYHLSRINQGNPVLSRGEEVFTFPDETIRALIKSPCTEPPCRPAPSKEQWNSRTVLIISCIGSFQQSVCEPRGDFQVQPKNRPFYIRGCSQAVT